jgi:death-on-curing protein
MNYLTLGQVILLAEFVTGIDENTLRKISRVELISSAVNAPQSEYAGVELYPDFKQKAAILCIRIAQNHGLPDGNKRLAWISLVMFCQINGYDFEVPTDDAVEKIISVASGSVETEELASWINQYLREKE